MSIIGGLSGLRADDTELIDDGADMTRVVATAVDEQGTTVPTEDRRIFIELSNGNFIGESPIHLQRPHPHPSLFRTRNRPLTGQAREDHHPLHPDNSRPVTFVVEASSDYAEQCRHNSCCLPRSSAGELATLHENIGPSYESGLVGRKEKRGAMSFGAGWRRPRQRGVCDFPQGEADHPGGESVG